MFMCITAQYFPTECPKYTYFCLKKLVCVSFINMGYDFEYI